MGKLRVLRIFKKKNIADRIDSLEDKIEDNFKPTALELATNWFTILGTAVSLVIAGWGIYLTHKYGESVEQINQLKAITTNQTAQTDRLIEIINRLENHNSLIRDEISIMKGMTEKISDQYKLSLKTDSRQVKEVSERMSKSRDKLTQVYSEVVDSLTSYRINGGVPSFHLQNESTVAVFSNRAKNLLSKVVVLMSGELTNDYLRNRAYSYMLWNEYISLCKQVMSRFYFDQPLNADAAHEVFMEITRIHSHFLATDIPFWSNSK